MVQKVYFYSRDKYEDRVYFKKNLELHILARDVTKHHVFDWGVKGFLSVFNVVNL
jgi:hypothetical protein